MRKELKRMTLIAYDDNTVEIVDVQGFMFPPTLAAVWDDFNGVGVFNTGPWTASEVSQSLIRLSMQIATGNVVHISEERTNE